MLASIGHWMFYTATILLIVLTVGGALLLPEKTFKNALNAALKKAFRRVRTVGLVYLALFGILIITPVIGILFITLISAIGG